MATWSKTPNGFNAVLFGRKCELVRRSGSSGATYRAIVEGVDEAALRNKGYARDFADGKEIVFEALVAAGVVPPRNPAGGPSSASRFAPNPVDLRARVLDTAVALLDSMGLSPVNSPDDISRRIAQVKSITLNLEKFVLSAGESGDHAADGGREPGSA